MKKNSLLCLTFLFFSVSALAQCWEQVSAGNGFTLAIKSDNTLWGWGSNTHGNLGDTTYAGKLSPALVSPDSNWVSVSCGHFMTFAMKSDGSIWAWGSNTHFALGIGSDDYPNYPTQIGSDLDWVQIDAGGNHGVALKSDSTIWGWGQNSFDQLGDVNFGMNSDSPLQLDSATNWKTIKAGSRNTLAINTNNQIWSAGSLTSGHLSNVSGSTTSFQLRNTDTDWANIFPGVGFSHGIKDNGKLFAEGANYYAQLGIDSISNYQDLTQVGQDSNWLSVYPGINHCIAIKTDSTLWAWGKNDKGELGDSTNVDKYYPIQIGTDSDWISASAQNQFSLALKSDGTLWSWGLNSSGQLGLGHTTNSNYPQQVKCDFFSHLNIKEDISNVSIYPNPTNGKVNVYLSKSYNEIEVNIYNTLGQLSQKEHFIHVKEIDFSIKGQNGIYFIVLKSNSKIIDRIKISKQL